MNTCTFILYILYMYMHVGLLLLKSEPLHIKLYNLVHIQFNTVIILVIFSALLVPDNLLPALGIMLLSVPTREYNSVVHAR